MRRIDEIMTKNPVCCTPDTKIEEVANLMVQQDCGEIPVVGSQEGKKLVGVITDRDIVVRSIAQGINPLELRAEECMTEKPITIKKDSFVHQACELMENYQIRRIPVVDDNDNICGMVSQSDIALAISESEAGTVVKHISEPSHVSH